MKPFIKLINNRLLGSPDQTLVTFFCFEAQRADMHAASHMVLFRVDWLSHGKTDLRLCSRD